MSDFVWEPTPDYVENANVTRLMRAHGIDDYRTLIKQSQDDIEWFWNAAVEDLDIEFFEPYERVLDASEGPQFPKWFVGGRVNLAHHCVNRHAAERGNSPAIAWEGEDGETRTLTYSDLAEAVARAAHGL